MSSPTSAGSSWRSGTGHADNKEKMRGAEAVKGNIPSNVPPSPLPSACAPSLLSPLQPLNLYSQGCTPSRALRGEQEAGMGTGSLLSPRQGEAGMRCLPRRRWPPSQLWARVKLTAMFKRPGGNYGVWKTWVHRGHNVKTGIQRMSIITHIVLTGPFIRGIIKQISIWRAQSLGKICRANVSIGRLGEPQSGELKESKLCHQAETTRLDPHDYRCHLLQLYGWWHVSFMKPFWAQFIFLGVSTWCQILPKNVISMLRSCWTDAVRCSATTVGNNTVVQISMSLLWRSLLSEPPQKCTFSLGGGGEDAVFCTQIQQSSSSLIRKWETSDTDRVISSVRTKTCFYFLNCDLLKKENYVDSKTGS